MKSRNIDPRYVDLTAIFLIGGVWMVIHEFELPIYLDFCVPLLFYYLGKWVRHKFGSVKEYDGEIQENTESSGFHIKSKKINPLYFDVFIAPILIAAVLMLTHEFDFYVVVVNYTLTHSLYLIGKWMRHRFGSTQQALEEIR